MAKKIDTVPGRPADGDDEQLAKRMTAYVEDIQTWTKGSGVAMVQLPGEPPRLMSVDEMRAAKKRSHH